MQSAFLANVVWLLHAVFLVWIMVAPFTGSEPMLVLHLVVVPFLWFHWWMNDDTCALTMVERQLRGVQSEDSFFHNLVSPVYKIRDKDARVVSWVISLLLWLVTVSKVMKRPAMIKDVFTGKGKK